MLNWKQKLANRFWKWEYLSWSNGAGTFIDRVYLLHDGRKYIIWCGMIYFLNSMPSHWENIVPLTPIKNTLPKEKVNWDEEAKKL